MAYGLISLEKRLKENIKYYSLENLYDLDEIQRLFCSLCEALGTELLLTERHGEKVDLALVISPDLNRMW